MIATLPIPRNARHPAWFGPLLLPALPFLTWILNGGTHLAPATIGAGLLLLALGLALALAIPSLLDHLGPTYRKEADLLRDAWLLGVLFVQVPLLTQGFASGDEPTFQLLAFATASALVASIPFGAEFQQRTLASLLSQPVRRVAWWDLKTSVLAIALGCLVVAFVLARLAMGQPATFHFTSCTLLIAAVAFGTTTCGTLLARSQLVGLAFSLVVPILAMPASAALAEWLAWTDLVRLVLEWSYETTEQMTSNLLLFGFAPTYAIAGYWLGRRAWLRLEAPDPSDTASGFRHPPTSMPVSISSRRAGRLAWGIRLAVKEVRLQSITWVAVGACIALAGTAFAFDTSRNLRELIETSLLLVAGATVLLAGSIAIAEERRLGTLDAEVLLPVSRATRWWSKFLVAGLLATAAVFLAHQVVSQPYANHPGAREELARIVLLTSLALFASAFLASSGSGTTIRAILIGLTGVAAAAVLGALAVSVASDQITQAQAQLRASTESNPETWLRKAEAAFLEPALLHAPNAGIVALLFNLLLPVPAVVALIYAWRNFRQPAEASRLLPGQFMRCGAAWLVALVVCGAGEIRFHQSQAQFEATRSAQAYLEVYRTFSPVDRQLWSLYRRGSFNTDIYPEVEPFSPQSTKRTRILHLPLSFPDRRLLIHRGLIPDHLKEALRQEGRARGEDVDTPPPEPPPSRLFYPMRPVYRPDAAGNPVLMDQGLRARYGLVPGHPTLPSTNPPTP
jgi:ABC-type transport system involved in multi-copper enzyme maturation permease subunit